jgi:hypothetical protein
VPAFRQGDYAGGLNAAVDQLAARIRGEALPAPTARPPADTGGDWQGLGLFFFVGVPILGSILSGLLGRRTGALLTGLGAGTLAGWLATSWLLGLGAGVVAWILVGVMGSGGRGGGSGGPPIIWGGGGGGGSWGGGGDGGGFSSGGGGDFGAAAPRDGGEMSHSSLADRLTRAWRHFWLDERDSRRALPPAALQRLTDQVQASGPTPRPDPPVRGGQPAGGRGLGRRHTRQRALECFGQLGVWDTEDNVGVLIYVLLADRAVEIVADRGLRHHVPEARWQTLAQTSAGLLPGARWRPG